MDQLVEIIKVKPCLFLCGIGLHVSSYREIII